VRESISVCCAWGEDCYIAKPQAGTEFTTQLLGGSAGFLIGDIHFCHQCGIPAGWRVRYGEVAPLGELSDHVVHSRTLRPAEQPYQRESAQLQTHHNAVMNSA
jgi:hypothetical protein